MYELYDLRKLMLYTPKIDRRKSVRIAVIGGGYVGLVTAICFADSGNHVDCIEIDQNKVDLLNNGHCTIYEPGLEALLQKNLGTQRLTFNSKIADLKIDSVDAIFIAVGTPPCPLDGRADLSYLENAVKSIAKQLGTRCTNLIIKSTVPVGTGRRLMGIIKEINPKANFNIISNPEFLREGSAVNDFFEADRIIVGIANDDAKKVMQKLYEPWSNRNIPIVFTNLETSELIKYTANCFLATRIALINEIANLCEKTGANIQDVAYGIGLDKRIGTGYLQPGPSYGGSCFPKDTIALVRTANDHNSPVTIIEAVIKSNENRKKLMFEKIANACSQKIADLSGKTIAILGVTFKANTNDLRDSAAIPIMEDLIKQGAQLKVYDPIAYESIKLENVSWQKDPYSALEAADLAVIMTEWEEFRTLDLSRLKGLLNCETEPTLVDLRNLFVPEEMAEIGINYISIGR